MILITSAAYVQGELVTEIGLIPPSFLPIGNKRLYEYQIELIRDSFETEEIFLSIPENYRINLFDKDRLAKLGVSILNVPEGLSLGNSILYCWNATAKYFENLKVLHGDTLFTGCRLVGGDSISIHPNKGVYQRATLGENGPPLSEIHSAWSFDNANVISGYFSFNSPLKLMKSLVERNGDFVKAIADYNELSQFNLFSNGVWLDFGHVNSFFSSRTQMTTQRAFNELVITNRYVEKHSNEKSDKIFAEGRWFTDIPSELRLHTPPLLALKGGANNHSSYKLEYMYLLPLSDLYVFGNLPVQQWGAIFDAVSRTLLDFQKYVPVSTTIKPSVFDALYLEKTLQRLKDYFQENKGSVQSYKIGDGEVEMSLEQIAKDSAKLISKTSLSDISVSHGDFCFSNILFDCKVECIKCIDPRGVLPNGELSVYGDRRYDVAKLYHSVVGLYDFIIAGQYQLTKIDNKVSITFPVLEEIDDSLFDSFKRKVLDTTGFKESEILAINIQLFLSMLPLHSDRPDRQEAFIANAIRLYELLVGLEK